MNEHIPIVLAEIEAQIAELTQLANSLRSFGIARGMLALPVVVDRCAPASNGAPDKPLRSTRKVGRASPRAAARGAYKRADGQPSTRDQLRGIIAEIDEPFDINNIIAVLDQHVTTSQRAVLKSALLYMGEVGEIVLVEKGKPHHPAKYRRADAAPAQPICAPSAPSTDSPSSVDRLTSDPDIALTKNERIELLADKMARNEISLSAYRNAREKILAEKE